MKKRVLIAILVSCFATGFIKNNASATEQNDVEISISPVSSEIKLAQGQTYQGKITVANIGKEAFSYQIAAKPLSVSSENYDLNYEEKTKYNNIADWVVLSKDSGSLESNSDEVVDYTIVVPEKALAGSQQFAIVASVDTISEGGTANFTITSGVASIIYATITGNAKDSGEVTKNSIPQFYTSGPVIVESLVENTGDLHNRATYTFEVKSFFTGETIFSNADEPLTHIIMPDTKRYDANSIDVPAIGIFKVTQTIEYLGQTSVVEQTVFVVPIWFMAIVALVLALIIIKIVFTIKKHRDI